MTEPALVPREVLLGNPQRVSPRISPDGTRLGYLAPVDGVLNVWVATVGLDDARPVTHDSDRGIREMFWSPDGGRVLYMQDRAGDENWRLHDVDPATGTTRDLTPFDGVQAQVLRVDQHHRDHLVVALNRDTPELHEPYRLDLGSGALTKLAESRGFAAWVVDTAMAPRAGMAPTPDGGIVLMVARDGQWEPVEVWGPEDALSSAGLGFSGDGRAMFLLSSKGANAGRLVRRDLATGADEVLAADDRFDVEDVVYDPFTFEPALVSYARDRVDWQALDPLLDADLDALRSTHPGDPVLLGHDDADRVWLVGFTADDGPVAYYAYDRTTKQATHLFDHRPDLRAYTLAPMEPFAVRSRDGLTLHGYLSFPPGHERRALPTVVLVHGGPWARDTWGFHPEAQLLANRGYLCVQVNFRGSTGYGKDFLNAGDREWGARMHDDLLDALEWVVAQGWADRDRVGIMGGSYGGYAALVGVTFTPEVFRCAVDIVGPSSLKTLIDSIPPYWAPMRAMFTQRLGDPETEADFLWSRSPLSKVDRIRRPVLIAQGANDPRVKVAESEQIVAAMRSHGVAHEYLLFEDEGHGFAKPENRLRFYAAAERFLARHLGGRWEE